MKESSIAAGVRRIEAVTGKEAENFAKESDQLIDKMASTLKVQPQKLIERIEKLTEEKSSLEKQLKELKMGQLQTLSAALLQGAERIRDVSLIAQEVDLSADELRALGDEVMKKLGAGLLLLASSQGGRAQLFVRVSPELVQKGVQAGGVIRELAALVDGTGGGKAEMAMAGGKSPEKLPLALLKVRDFIP